jgi:hypothetical protein
MVVMFRPSREPSGFNTRLIYWTSRVAGVLAGCQMPWPGVLGLTAAVEDGIGANSDPSVSITEPSVVNVARPGIGTAGVDDAMGVKVNCHDPANDSVVAAAHRG